MDIYHTVLLQRSQTLKSIVAIYLCAISVKITVLSEVIARSMKLEEETGSFLDTEKWKAEIRAKSL